ncbi:MAG: cysteine--tRNA ligase [Planctomycetes bacterium]|nr:cysteine--tRNA ligase [Planctomycetota bacterium]
MTLTLTNTLSRAKESLPAPGERPIQLYTCGPTVYNHVHIGNWRAFVFYDVLRRSLEWLGYEVRHVMNLTDVDDKTIRGSREAGQSLREFTDRYTQFFLEDLDELRILHPHAMPRATDAIDSMVALVKRLEAKGLAYQSDDGSYYFKISGFENYGQLAHLDVDTLRAGAGGRVAADEYEKDDVTDFALWKAWSEEDGDVFWETELGKGRPGWHLECSALAMEHLSESIDIHAGGIDLVFPHHENEIAQAEAATGKVFSKFWVHNEHLMVGGKKMSKSLKNFFTFRELQEVAGATGREVRYALLTGHYSKKLNLQVTYEGEGEERRPVLFDSIEAARSAIHRLDEFRRGLTIRGGGPVGDGARALVEGYQAAIRAAIADDLNVPAALGKLFELVTDVNKLPDFDEEFGRFVVSVLDDVDQVLGVLKPEADAGLTPEDQALFTAWGAAREAKDWAGADTIRAQLKEHGIQVQARKGESTWSRI